MGVLRNLRTAVLHPHIFAHYAYFETHRRLSGRTPTLPMPKGGRLHSAERFNDYWSICVQRPGDAEYQLIEGLLPERSATVVDVGANVGAWSVLAGSTGRVGRIVAFEPAHRYCQAWHTNMAANGVRGATLIQAAASDESGVARFRADPALPLHGRFDRGVLYASDCIMEVAVARLDEILLALGVTSVDLLKVDVEGAEPAVMRGAKGLLERQAVRAIFIEFIIEHMEDMGEDPQAFVDAIVGNGYALHAIQPDGRVGRALDPAHVVNERRVAPNAPNRPWHEINIVALRAEA
jgi:FkbM family methyltransferase